MADQSCIIRPAAETDLEALGSLLQTLFAIEEDFTPNEELQEKGLRLMLENKRGCILVAEIEGRVVGMCSGQITISTAEGGPAVLVEDVVVHAPNRREGIGSMLMDAITMWAKGHGASRLQLLADRNNIPALDFYSKIGWSTTDLICLRKTGQ